MTPAAGIPPPAAPCPSWQDDLKAFVDGELPLVRRVTLQRHLSGCAACRAEMEAMQRIGQSLRQAEGADATASVLDPALRSRILAAMQDAAAASSGAPDEAAADIRLRSSRPAFRFAPATAFALAALALFVAIVTTPQMSSLREQAGSSTFSAEKSEGATAASGAAAGPSATGAVPSGGFAAPGAASTAAEEAPEAAEGRGSGSVAGIRSESMKAGAPASPAADATTTPGGPMAQTAKQSAAARRPDAAYSPRKAETAAARPPAGRQGRKAAGSALTVTTETVPVPHTESLTLTVTRIEDSAGEVERLSRLSGGTLTSRAAVYAQEEGSSSKSDRKTQIMLSLQLPADRANAFIARLSEIGQVTERQTGTPAIPKEQQQRQQGAATTDVKVLLREK